MSTVTAIGTQTAAQMPQGLDQATGISSDFQTFLKMLTTQARNQDPLNPMDSSDYAQQLATFSGVEQQVRTNSLLESLASQLGGTGLAQFASWIGMEARVTAPVPFEGAPLTLYPDPIAGADQAVLVTLDAAGNEIGRTAAQVGTDPINWAGTDSSGQPYASGTYSFRLESYAAGQLIGTTDVASFVTITEIRSGAGGTRIVLEGGSEVSADEITALRTAV